MDKRIVILRYLKENIGEWVSGQNIAGQLGISRNGVSKHVKVLKKMQYQIEASTRKGYRLIATTAKMNKYEVALDEGTKLLGRDIFIFNSLASTNIEAKRRSLLYDAEGTVIIAEHQTAAKGRRKSEWFSASERGLYFSLILHPNCSIDRIPLLIAIAGDCLIKSISRITKTDSLQFQWPNTIISNGKKVAGILTDNSTDLESVNKSILGIGCYTHLEEEDYSAKEETSIASLNSELGVLVDRNILLADFLDTFETEYLKFKAGDIDENLEKWSENLVIVDDDSSLDLESKTHSGTITGFDNEGYLIIEDTDGNKYSVNYGNMKMIKPE